MAEIMIGDIVEEEKKDVGLVDIEIGEPLRLEMTPAHKTRPTFDIQIDEPAKNVPDLIPSHVPSTTPWTTSQGVDPSDRRPWTTTQGVDTGPTFEDVISIGVKNIGPIARKSMAGFWMLAGDVANRPDAFEIAKADYQAADAEMQTINKPLTTFWQKVGAGAAGNIAMQAPAAIGTAALGLGAAPILISMGLMSGFSKYGEYRVKGIDPWKAGIGGTVVGLAEAGTEKIAFREFLRMGTPFFKRIFRSMIYGEMPGETINTAIENATDWAIAEPNATLGDFARKLFDDELMTLAQVVLSTPGIAGSVHPFVKVQETRQAKLLKTTAMQAGLNEQEADRVVKDVINTANGKTPEELSKSIETNFNSKVKSEIDRKQSQNVEKAEAGADTATVPLDISATLSSIQQKADELKAQEDASKTEEQKAKEVEEKQKKIQDRIDKLTATINSLPEDSKRRKLLQGQLNKLTQGQVQEQQVQEGTDATVVREDQGQGSEAGEELRRGTESSGSSVQQSEEEGSKGDTGEVEQSPIRTIEEWRHEYYPLWDKTLKAEKEPTRKMTDKEKEVWKEDWKAFSRLRGYTEEEIADYDRYLQLREEGRRLGVSEEELSTAKPPLSPQTNTSTQPVTYKTKREALIQAKKVGGTVGGEKGAWTVVPKVEATETKKEEPKVEKKVPDKKSMTKEEKAEFDELIDEVESGMFDSSAEAEVYRATLGDKADYFTVTPTSTGEFYTVVYNGNKEEASAKAPTGKKKEAVQKSDKPKDLPKSAKELAETNPLFFDNSQAPEDSLHGAIDKVRNDATAVYKAGGDLSPVVKMISDMVAAHDFSPRSYMKNFASVVKYREWRDKLMRTAEYVQQLGKANKKNTTISFMGTGDLVRLTTEMITEDIPKAIEYMTEVGRRVYDSGASKFHQFVGKMKNIFLDIWDKVEPRLTSIFDVVLNERGAIQLGEVIKDWRDTRTFHKQKELDARTYGVDSDQKITTNEQEIISPAWQWLMSPKGMFVFKNIPEQAKQTIRDIYNAKKRWLYETINENNDIGKLERQLTEEERKQVTVLGNKIQDISHRARTALAKRGLTSDQIDTILQPKIEEFIDNYQASDKVKDMYRTVRDEFFDKFQALYKKHLFRDLRYHTKENFKKAIDDIFVRGVPWEVALDSNDIKKSEDVRRFKAALQSYTEQLGEISKWGLSDYWTHFMRGNIVVRDGNNIITVALRTKDAIDRAKEYLADHPEVKEIKIDNSFLYTDLPQLIGRKQYQILRGRFNKVIKEEIEDMTTALADEKVRRLLKRVVSVNPAEVFAGPTLDTKWVLPGEENIFDAMRAYSRVMWKKMTFDPVIWDMRANLDKYTGNVQDFLQKTLDDAKGRYWMGDKVLDYFMEKLGVESSNTYSGIVGKVRKGTVWMKLGYRPVAAVVNGIDGFSRIFLENDAKVTIKALRYLNSPEGQALMDRYSWQLGTQAIEEEGHVTSKMKLYSPLGIFNAPELPVRRWNWMTAYMAYKEDKLKNIPNYPTDKLEEEAINFAADSVDRLQGANILCSVPAIMRSPTGRLLTVFKPFLSRTIEMMVYNRNNFSFWAKFIPYIGLVGGPRAIIAMAKSFPFIAAIAAALGIDSLWDRLDEYVLRKIPSWAGGLASQFGMDIVGPATVQLPTSWMDLVGGAAFSTMYNTANVIGEAMGANNWWGITKQGVKKEIPAINNLWSVYDSVVDKNGWVRDEKGEPQYNLYTGWDKGIMLFGAKPQARSYVEVINRIAMQQKAKEIEKSKDIYAYLKRRIANENTVTPDMLQQVKDDIVKYHITMQSFDEALANIHIPKGMRAILKSDVVDRPDLWEKVKEADKAYASKILFPKK